MSVKLGFKNKPTDDTYTVIDVNTHEIEGVREKNGYVEVFRLYEDNAGTILHTIEGVGVKGMTPAEQMDFLRQCIEVSPDPEPDMKYTSFVQPQRKIKDERE